MSRPPASPNDPDNGSSDAHKACDLLQDPFTKATVTDNDLVVTSTSSLSGALSSTACAMRGSESTLSEDESLEEAYRHVPKGTRSPRKSTSGKSSRSPIKKSMPKKKLVSTTRSPRHGRELPDTPKLLLGAGLSEVTSTDRFKLVDGKAYEWTNGGWKVIDPDICDIPKTYAWMREVAEYGPFTWSRRKDSTEDWKLKVSYLQDSGSNPDLEIDMKGASIADDLSSTTDKLTLYLVLQEQQGPRHWSLFLAKDNEPGKVYQVMGDSTYMTYHSRDNVKLLSSKSYVDSLILNEDVNSEQQQTVEMIAAAEPPLRALNEKEVRENCQHWTIRVLTKLVDAGVVSDVKLASARGWLQPLGE